MKTSFVYCILLLGSYLSLSSGSFFISPADLLHLFFTPDQTNPTAIVFFQHRLPRFLMALVAGSSLGMCGLMMQTFFRNPLAGPSVLGISSAASFGAAFSIFSLPALNATLLTSSMSLVGSSLLGAFLLTSFLMLLSMKKTSQMVLLIVGLMASYLFASLVSILISLSDAYALQKFVVWGFGSFSSVPPPAIILLSLSLAVSVLLLFPLSSALDLYLMDEAVALTSGVNIPRLKIVLLLVTCGLTGLVTAYCGPIAFLGIASPHLVRFIYKTGLHQKLLPLTCLMGANLAVWGDWIARLPGYEGAIPLNAVLSLMGAPVIIYLLLQKKATV